MKNTSPFLILALMISSLFLMFPAIAQETKPCEQCGMTVDATGQTRFNIVDVNGTRHYACCPICALRMTKTYGQLNITSFCDWNGPSYPITINVKQYGSVVNISPPSSLIILGGGCTKNRIVYNSAAADTLLAPPNNGTSKWLSPLTNATVLANATRIGIAQAALQYGGGVPSECEQCGMTVDATGQARFRILDANGTTHIACCPVCALRMLKTYGQLAITSYCDYYGPSYPITINAKEYGTDVTIAPPNTLIVLGGGCTKNRIVYNATAADALLAPPNNGTSRWLSPLSNDTVAANSTRIDVVQAALQYGGGVPSPSPNPTSSPTPIQTASPSPTQTPYPTQDPTPTANPTPSTTATQSPAPTQSPTTAFSPNPSATPTPISTTPTPAPTKTPLVETPTPTPHASPAVEESINAPLYVGIAGVVIAAVSIGTVAFLKLRRK